MEMDFCVTYRTEPGTGDPEMGWLIECQHCDLTEWIEWWHKGIGYVMELHLTRECPQKGA